jgi:hypothetical protein
MYLETENGVFEDEKCCILLLQYTLLPAPRAVLQPS